MTRYTVSRDDTLAMLFPDDMRAKLAEVKGWIEPADHTEDYEIIPHVSLTINFDSSPVPTIVPSFMQLNLDRAQPLLIYLEGVYRVHMQYELVKAVVRWLNSNATPGAVRYYWPSAMKLMPQHPMWKDLQEVPTRFVNPVGIEDWTQALKETATTMAASAMLPETSPPKRDTMWLNIRYHQAWLPGEVAPATPSKFSTDGVGYNINNV